MSECSECLHESKCTPFEKQFDGLYGNCEEFINMDFNYDCSTNGSVTAKWKEFSYNKYTENILDYGELSDWDKFLLEEKYY